MLQSEQPATSKKSIETWLTRWIAEVLGVPAQEIDPTHSLLDYSLSSVTATMLVGDLEDWLGLVLSPTLVWDYPSIEELVGHLTVELQRTSAAIPNEIGSHAVTEPVGGPRESSDLDAQQLLSNLETFSDLEVSAILERLMSEEQAGIVTQSSPS